MKKILGASIGSDVHVAGLYNFMELAKREGYRVIYLGGAVLIEKLVEAIIESDPDIIAISYRLGAEPLRKLLDELLERLKKYDSKKRRFVFGGTIETARVAREYGIFEKVFDGTEEIEEVIAYLKGYDLKMSEKDFPQFLPERIEFKKPFPLFRHHIGLETLEKTEEEIKKLAESRLLDIISLAPDQNAQQFFFEPEKMDPKQNGAGGAPIRTKEDFIRLYEASRRGNYPLVRSYSGTRNLIKFSKLLKETINNAWAAIPIFWYSDLDRRSDRELYDAIKENLEAIKWNAQNNVPVEINDSHQWAMRNAHDSLEVAIAYLSAYVAKALGVKWYIQQYMFNTPPSISPKMDIAKMIAKKQLVESLKDENFKVYTMVRTGLLSFPADLDSAKGQLVSSMFYASYFNPDIIHVVAFCEAVHRATSKEIIESVKMVKRAYILASQGLPDFLQDKEIYDRVEKIKDEALEIIEAIKTIGKKYEGDPLINPKVLYNAVKFGILDAPGLTGFSVARGKIKTQIINGANVVIDENGEILSERERLRRLFSRGEI